MDINLAVLADAANRAESGKLNLLGVFQTIHAPVVPCQHPYMSLVLNLVATAMERGTNATVRVQMIDEDGRSILTLPDQQVAIPSTQDVLTPNVNLIVYLANVTFEKHGAYRFDILVNGECLARIPLHVVRA